MKSDDNKQRWWRQKKRYERKYVLVNKSSNSIFLKKYFTFLIFHVTYLEQMKRSSVAWRLWLERLAERGVPDEDMEERERLSERAGVLAFVLLFKAAASAFLRCHLVCLDETAGIEKLMALSNATCDSTVEGFIVVCFCIFLQEERKKMKKSCC